MVHQKAIAIDGADGSTEGLWSFLCNLFFYVKMKPTSASRLVNKSQFVGSLFQPTNEYL